MSEFIRILEKIESGEISADEGARLMRETKGEVSQSKKKDIKEIDILEQIENGNLSIDEGLEKFKTVEKPNISSNFAGETFTENDPITGKQTMPVTEKEMQKWQNWWAFPVFAGFSFVILSAYWMNSIYENSGTTFWFYFSWIPLFLGIVIMAFSWPSPNRTWLHVRVKQAPGEKPEKISISLPIPISFVSWGIGIAKRFGPEDKLAMIDELAIDELLSSFSKSANKGTPFFVEVEEGEKGERVEIYIG